MIPSGISTIEWDATIPSEDFDWQGYLGKLYASQ